MLALSVNPSSAHTSRTVEPMRHRNGATRENCPPLGASKQTTARVPSVLGVVFYASCGVLATEHFNWP